MISPYIRPDIPRSVAAIADRCRAWDGAVDAQGYPRQKVQGVSMYAHRVAFVEYHRALNPGERVYRACGDRRCVNPLHLVTERPAPKGKRRRHATAKLNAPQVRAIRTRWARPDRPTQRQLAAEYGVTRTAISHVVHRRTWAHV